MVARTAIVGPEIPQIRGADTCFGLADPVAEWQSTGQSFVMGSFGELLVDGHRPEHGGHVIASIQSLAQVDLDDIPPEAFNVVILDEFHHAAASTYEWLLNHLRPRSFWV